MKDVSPCFYAVIAKSVSVSRASIYTSMYSYAPSRTRTVDVVSRDSQYDNVPYDTISGKVMTRKHD